MYQKELRALQIASICFECINVVIGGHQLKKVRQCNGKRKQAKHPDNDGQNTTQKTKRFNKTNPTKPDLGMGKTFLLH
jgi:hypothetical protein